MHSPTHSLRQLYFKHAHTYIHTIVNSCTYIHTYVLIYYLYKYEVLSTTISTLIFVANRGFQNEECKEEMDFLQTLEYEKLQKKLSQLQNNRTLLFNANNNKYITNNYTYICISTNTIISNTCRCELFAMMLIGLKVPKKNLRQPFPSHMDFFTTNLEFDFNLEGVHIIASKYNKGSSQNIYYSSSK